MDGRRDEGRFANVVIPPRNSLQTEVMHGKEDQIGAEERNPEMELAERVVEHPSRYLGVPMIDLAQYDYDGLNAHHHMEMSDDEHGIQKGHIHDAVAEQKSGE